MIRVVVIGAGLAGMTAALYLAEHGARVTVIARGAGSLHLSPGTIDVLGYASKLVESPDADIPAFVGANPRHPYRRLGGDIAEAVSWLLSHLAILRYVGDGETNMLLPTAVGVARPTAFAPASMAAADLRQGGRFVAVGLSALKDFFPKILADNLERASLPDGATVAVRHAEVAVSPRPGWADVAAPVFARALDDGSLMAPFADALRRVVEPGETVLVPAVLGLDRGPEVWDDLCERVGAPVAEIPTLPPSIPGMRLSQHLTAAVSTAGGTVVLGPSVVGGSDGGGRITEVLVKDAARTREIRVDAVVLATGGFSAGGLDLDSHGELRETVFDLAVAGPPPGEPRFSARHLDHQPLMAAGLEVDDVLRPCGPGGQPRWANLHAAGAMLAGAEPWREKSGEGIAIASGYRAARAILEEI